MNAPGEARLGLLECMAAFSHASSPANLLVLVSKINICLCSAQSLPEVQKLIGLLVAHENFARLISGLIGIATTSEQSSVVALTCLQTLLFSQEALPALVHTPLPDHLLGLLKASTSSCSGIEPVIVLSSFRLLVALVKADSHLVDCHQRLVDRQAVALAALVAFYLEKKDGSSPTPFIEPALELLESMVVRRKGAQAILASHVTTSEPPPIQSKRFKNAVKVARTIMREAS
jgi:hypothetical protein